VASGAADPGALGPGDALGERFEVLAVLAAGPEGAVLQARDRELGDVVAVEALAPSAVARPDVFTRLDSPLQSVRKLAHPGIARTYDYGRAGGVPFLAREHVPGTPVEKLLATPGRLPAAAALGLARQLAAALASAHRDGVAHGRLTPDRLVLGADGRLKVTGFGLAGVLAAPSVPGEPGALPPEGPGGPRGDVYAAAALLHRLLLGSWPEPGAAPAAEGLPEGLAPALAAALARDPAKRPDDGAALLAALDRVRV
jgi:serine/threonine-protein kinase